MHAPGSRNCPPWCVADHETEDEGARRRHRGATATVAGVAIRGTPPHDAHPVELLIEVHADDDDTGVAVYIGDGVEGLDLTAETAVRLVRCLTETLKAAGSGDG